MTALQQTPAAPPPLRRWAALPRQVSSSAAFAAQIISAPADCSGLPVDDLLMWYLVIAVRVEVPRQPPVSSVCESRCLPLTACTPSTPPTPQEQLAGTEQQVLERTILDILRKRKPGATC